MNCLNELLDAQLSDSAWSEEIWRSELNREYNEFVKTFGFISSDANRHFFGDDPRFSLLRSLENNNQKTEIFYKTTTKGYKAPDKCDSAKDALIHYLNTFGKVDIDWIEDRYGDQ